VQEKQQLKLVEQHNVALRKLCQDELDKVENECQRLGDELDACETLEAERCKDLLASRTLLNKKLDELERTPELPDGYDPLEEAALKVSLPPPPLPFLHLNASWPATAQRRMQ
jgi:hypothetical protein